MVDEAGGRCEICGYKRSLRALSFHHVEPAQKEFSVSQGLHSRAMEELRAEARKCLLLCMNCHFEYHELDEELG